MSNKTYIEQCLAGDVLVEDIDDFVASWHNDPVAQGSLRDNLGFSKEEYKLWAEKPEALPFIILAHKNNVPLRKVIEEHSIAAG